MYADHAYFAWMKFLVHEVLNVVGMVTLQLFFTYVSYAQAVDNMTEQTYDFMHHTKYKT